MPGLIDTVSKRAQLAPRKNPYWHGVSGGRGGVSLGYRKGAGAGVWVAKIVLDGQRTEERLGLADDDDGARAGALSFRSAVSAALQWSRERHAAIEAGASVADGPTVRTAVEAYIDARKARSAREGKSTAGRLTRHVLSNNIFANTRLAKLAAADFEGLRSRLKETQPETTDDESCTLAPATVNRVLNDLRAALNAYVEAHRRELPSHLVAEIRVGTRAEPVTGDARKQLLTDKQIREAVKAAYAVDKDFGALVMLAAVTGARHSQMIRLTVGNVQYQQKRVMMPGSRKGRAATAHPPVALPLTDDALEKLRPITRGRASSAPLLMRWAYRNVGPFKWEKESRRSWGHAFEVDKYWARVVEKAKLPPDTIMYAFRHSSIVRGLRAGLPIRLVASLHDTSTEMIEKHYSAYIVDVTEDLARRAALPVFKTPARSRGANGRAVK